MSRLFYHVMQDNAGNLLFDVSGTMRLAGTGTAATIYGDAALTVPIANPMTNHPSFGSFKCYLGAGLYDFYMAKSGYTFETLTGLQGWGTMALQDGSAVNITGGLIDGPTVRNLGTAAGAITLTGEVGIGTAAVASQSLTVRYPSQLMDRVGIRRIPAPAVGLAVSYLKATEHGIQIGPSDNDTGGGGAVLLANLAGTLVGSIFTTATTTAFNTTSDARLKHDVEPLTGELALIRALRPVSFLWNADGSPGVGFIASEVAAQVQGVITGEPDAVNEDGSIKPQMIDYSKLVPFLVGACQTLARRLAVLEDALGI